jgi:hypothetical protein
VKVHAGSKMLSGPRTRATKHLDAGKGLRLARQGACLVSLWMMAFAGNGATRGQTPGSSEYDVKAAFLFHFAQFVEWPPETFKDASAPLTYCTIGEDPFHGALEQSLSGKTVGTRALRVQHLKQTQGIPGCQVLFIGAGEKKRIGEEMARVSGNAVLTVGETEHFAKEGGIIGFFLEDNKIRFEINLDAAEKANLRISARLLTLARTVIGKPRGT